MRINLTTPMSDDKERQRQNAAMLGAIERYTEERMNDEYGRIHTDGSRSGGQPIVIREGRTMKGGVVSQESPPHRPAPPAPNKAVAKIEALRQPTQSDALREALDLLGVALAEHGHTWTVEERTAYEKARAILEQSK